MLQMPGVSMIIFNDNLPPDLIQAYKGASKPTHYTGTKGGYIDKTPLPGKQTNQHDPRDANVYLLRAAALLVLLVVVLAFVYFGFVY